MLSRLWYYLILFTCSFTSLTADGYPSIRLSSGTLKTANLFFRHGARTPLVDPPKMAKIKPISWDEPSGLLTKTGKEKMFKLGLTMREMYNDFLNPLYFPGEIFVITTPLERTSSSAKSLLAGLYNSRNYSYWSEDIPVTIVPISVDENVIDKSNIINEGRACPVFKAEQKLAIKRAMHDDTGFQDVYNYLSLYAGSKVNGMYDIFPLWDVIECLAHNYRELPDWASFVYPVRMSLITAKVLHSLIAGSEKMIRLAAGPYMEEIHKQFNDVVMGSPTVKKLVIHGGHDFSMTANLGALGVLEKIVNPGDAIIMELHEIPYAGFFVQLLYVEAGGESVTVVPIKTCGQPCPLEKFFHLTKDVIPNNWMKECLNFYNV